MADPSDQGENRARPGHRRFSLSLAEPAVALTDLVLAAETGLFAVLIARGRRGSGALRAPLILFFTATAAASIAGAILHGPVADRADPRHRRLWRLATTSVGVAGFSGWWLAARLALGTRGSTLVTGLAATIQLRYLARSVRQHLPYRAAVNAYLPGALALTGALVSRLAVPADRGSAARALVALGITFVAAGVQVRKIALHRRYFDHNALYHLLQGIGMAVFFVAARDLDAAVTER